MTQHRKPPDEPSDEQLSSQLEQVRAARQIALRQRSYTARRSRLERHRTTIHRLHDQGASLSDIHAYLRTLASPRVDVARSTVLRYLRSIGLRR